MSVLFRMQSKSQQLAGHEPSNSNPPAGWCLQQLGCYSQAAALKFWRGGWQRLLREILLAYVKDVFDLHMRRTVACHVERVNDIPLRPTTRCRVAVLLGSVV